MHIQTKYSQSGLTLLETLISAVIFSVATVALSALFAGSQESNVKASKRLAANTLASRYLEEAVEMARYGVVPSADAGTFIVKTTRRGAKSESEYQWNRTSSVLANGTYDVEVIVNWSYGDEDQSVSREILVYPAPI